jgi:hypothetical protein
MLRTLTIALSLLAGTVACSKSDKPAPEAKPTAAPPAGAGANTELEHKGLAAMQRLGALFAAAGNNCDQLATDVKAFLAEQRPLFVELTTLEKRETQAQRDDFERRNKPVQDAVGQQMAAALKACDNHPGLIAAMKEFPGNE